jgi:hypothetical protein
MSMSAATHRRQNSQDDIELLRTYGLDKFTLLDIPNGNTNVSMPPEDTKRFSNGAKNPFRDGYYTQQRPSSSSSQSTKWTTFD